MLVPSSTATQDQNPQPRSGCGLQGSAGRHGDAGHPTATGLLTGLFSIAAMMAAINSIVGGAGSALLPS